LVKSEEFTQEQVERYELPRITAIINASEIREKGEEGGNRNQEDYHHHVMTQFTIGVLESDSD
jgi:hypothetical protein